MVFTRRMFVTAHFLELYIMTYQNMVHINMELSALTINQPHYQHCGALNCPAS